MTERSLNLDSPRKIALILRGRRRVPHLGRSDVQGTENSWRVFLPSLGWTRLAARKSRFRHRAASWELLRFPTSLTAMPATPRTGAIGPRHAWCTTWS